MKTKTKNQNKQLHNQQLRQIEEEIATCDKIIEHLQIYDYALALTLCIRQQLIDEKTKIEQANI